MLLFDNKNFKKQPEKPKLEIYDKILTITKGEDLTEEQLKLLAEEFAEILKHPPITFNEKIYDEVKDYFITELDQSYHPLVHQYIGPVARNLIPEVIRIRRKLGYNFKLKLINADMAKDFHNLIDYEFVSVNEDGEQDDRVIFQRTELSGFQIIIN